MIIELTYNKKVKRYFPYVIIYHENQLKHYRTETLYHARLAARALIESGFDNIQVEYKKYRIIYTKQQEIFNPVFDEYLGNNWERSWFWTNANVSVHFG